MKDFLGTQKRQMVQLQQKESGLSEVSYPSSAAACNRLWQVLWDMEQQIKTKSTKQQRTQKKPIGDAERCNSVYMIVVLTRRVAGGIKGG